MKANQELREEVKSRLSIVKQNNRLKAYRLIKEWAETNDEFIRPCHTSGSGRFTTNLDYTQQTMWLLNKMGVDFEAGNDSPRGGKCGQYIIIKGVKG